MRGLIDIDKQRTDYLSESHANGRSLMSLVTPITAGLCSVLALAACSPSGLNMSQSATHTQAASGHTVHRNPQPKQAYRITMRIDNAPGPFAKMLGLAQFDVVNTECLRPPKDNPGGYSSPVPTDAAEIPLTQVNDNTWSGVVYESPRVL